MVVPLQQSNWSHIPEDCNLLVVLDISLITGLIMDTNARYCILISSLVRYFEVVRHLYKGFVVTTMYVLNSLIFL
jgi:hypothetical protein